MLDFRAMISFGTHHDFGFETTLSDILSVGYCESSGEAANHQVKQRLKVMLHTASEREG